MADQGGADDHSRQSPAGAVGESHGWPRGGPWLIAGTASGVDWPLAAAVLAAAARVRVALLVLGAAPPGPALLLDRVAVRLDLLDGGAGPPTVADVAGLVTALRRAHGLVLIAAAPGLLVPVGDDGWTAADLAVALSAPAVVVTGAGPDAVNHGTLVLDALSRRGVPATVIAIGDDGDGFAGLPVAPAGRIPVGAADRPDGFSAAAPGWLDPVLHAGGTGRRAIAPVPAGRPPVRTFSGRRVTLALLAVFAVAAVLACGLALLNRPADRTERLTLYASAGVERLPPRAVPVRPSLPLAPGQSAGSGQSRGPGQSGGPGQSRGPGQSGGPGRSSDPGTAVCPRFAGGIVAGRDDPGTRRRVDAAWQRIETWLARHAPAGRRALRAPAGTARIDTAQRRMSVPFPADLVASLRRHDGAAGFALPPFFAPLSVDGIVGAWEVNCTVLADLGPGFWDPDLVPFAAAGDGGSLVVDQRDGGHGRVGEFYPENGTMFERWPASMVELLEGTARCLETGRPYAGRYRPKVVGGRLGWDIG